jgi:basic membrane protein A and related proteins
MRFGNDESIRLGERWVRGRVATTSISSAGGAVDSISRRHLRAAGRGRRWSSARAFPAFAALALIVSTISVASGSAANPSSRTSGVTSRSYSPGFLACEVTNTAGIMDQSFNALTWKGLQAAKRTDPSMRIEYRSSVSKSDYARNVAAFVASKCGIIVTVGQAMAAATQQAATKYPTQDFAIVDDEFAAPINNVLTLSYETNQAAFLGGYLAAALSKTGTVGTFGGENVPSVTIYMDGWVAGVRYYDEHNHKHVTVLGWTPTRGRSQNSFSGSGLFTLSFTNGADGRTDALSEIQRGADVIFPVTGSGAVSLGAADSVKENKGVTMEWVDTDGCIAYPSYCSLFVTSVTKGVVATVSHAALLAASGEFKGGNYSGTLANNGVGIAPYHQYAKLIPQSVQKEIEKLREGIIAGKVSVDPNSYPVG